VEHERIWKIGDGKGIDCLLRSSFICTDLIGVGTKGMVSTMMGGVIHASEVGGLGLKALFCPYRHKPCRRKQNGVRVDKLDHP
jgi:hypothetical protein